MGTRSSKPATPKVTEKEKKGEKDTTMEVEKTAEQKAEEKMTLVIHDLKSQLKEIERAVHNKEPRVISKVLRQLPRTRREVSTDALVKIIQTLNLDRKAALLSALGCSQHEKSDSSSQLVMEGQLYLSLLILLKLLDSDNHEAARELADHLVTRIGKQAVRRSADPLNAKVYYYHSRVYELLGRSAEARPVYMKCLRTTSLHGEVESESVLMNVLLRNYMHNNLLDQAEKLVSKSQFPESANNNEWARYLYYTGRIKAIQLEYSDAQKTITTALRKAPQVSAIGFRQSATKLLTVVDLLMGDIPERSRFLQKKLEKYGANFKNDRTYTLILRLRHNVIKTGIRRISLSYSKISLADVSRQLALDSPEDAEFIVAKAIRDGVIDGVIDHQAGTSAFSTVNNYTRSRSRQCASQLKSSPTHCRRRSAASASKQTSSSPRKWPRTTKTCFRLYTQNSLATTTCSLATILQ